MNITKFLDSALNAVKALDAFITKTGISIKNHKQEIDTLEGFTTFYFYLPISANEAAQINWDFTDYLIEQNLHSPEWGISIIGTKQQLKSVK